MLPERVNQIVPERRSFTSKHGGSDRHGFQENTSHVDASGYVQKAIFPPPPD